MALATGVTNSSNVALFESPSWLAPAEEQLGELVLAIGLLVQDDDDADDEDDDLVDDDDDGGEDEDEDDDKDDDNDYPPPGWSD